MAEDIVRICGEGVRDGRGYCAEGLWGNGRKVEGRCGSVEEQCVMAEGEWEKGRGAVRNGRGRLRERWRSGAEWQRENRRKTEGRYGRGGEVNSKGNLGGLLKIYL